MLIYEGAEHSFHLRDVIVVRGSVRIHVLCDNRFDVSCCRTERTFPSEYKQDIPSCYDRIYDQYLGVNVARVPSWWSHQEEYRARSHFYLHNISIYKLIIYFYYKHKHLFIFTIYFTSTTIYQQPNGIRFNIIITVHQYPASQIESTKY